MKQAFRIAAAIAVCALASASAHAEWTIDCSAGQSLQNAVLNAPPNSSIFVKGVCSGPITITTDGLRIVADLGAQINGKGKDAVTVDGAQRVVLKGLLITGGNNGVVVDRGGQATLQNDHITGNALTGILVQAHSSATLGDGDDRQNGFDGIDVESTSALIINGTYSITQNGVFGIDINNGSSLTLTGAHLSVQQNTVGVQLGTNASGFLDGQSSLDASANFTVGLTMVSGSHMVDFGGAILTNENGNNGLSLNSKAGLDLDAGAAVTSNGNAGDGVHLEQLSVMTIFNNPLFSGSNATTLLVTRGNQGDGV
ncbi:MAG TPA: right-handed parallel beta-helix repeat-containing protein, partial [Acidisarcina sp.]